MHDVCRPSKTLKAIAAVLTVTTVLSTDYAYRQSVWADELHKRLVETNQDDVKLMGILTSEEKKSVCNRFRSLGEIRIAGWIESQYLNVDGLWAGGSETQ
jgi:hypothetical protein